jgi:hypothetical protein
MNTMLDARIVALSTHRACDAEHGTANGAARMDAASEGGNNDALIDGRRQATPAAACNAVQKA